MKNKVYKISFLLLLSLWAIGFHSTASGWSWRDLKVGETTEGEIISQAGLPESVILSSNNYFLIKLGETPGNVKFLYTDSKLKRKLASNLPFLYNPSKTPIITEAPLRLSEEMENIEVRVFIRDGRLSILRYDFWFYSKIDKKKYIEMFSSMLGKSIQVDEKKEESISIKYNAGVGNCRLEITDKCVSLIIE